MRFGLDLGGTKMEAVIIDDSGAIVWRERRPTPAADYHAIIESIGALVAKADTQAGKPVSVGIGMPGSLSPQTGLVRNSNTLSLNGQPIKQDLQNHFPTVVPEVLISRICGTIWNCILQISQNNCKQFKVRTRTC